MTNPPEHLTLTPVNTDDAPAPEPVTRLIHTIFVGESPRLLCGMASREAARDAVEMLLFTGGHAVVDFSVAVEINAPGAEARELKREVFVLTCEKVDPDTLGM